MKKLVIKVSQSSSQKNNIACYYDDINDVSKIKQIINEPVPPPKPIINTDNYQKPWYEFLGGKIELNVYSLENLHIEDKYFKIIQNKKLLFSQFFILFWYRFNTNSLIMTYYMMTSFA